jgi:CRP-like cAMP-binding protein
MEELPMGMLGFDLPFTLRLSAFVDLSEPDRMLLNRAASWPGQVIPARKDIWLEGERPRSAFVVLEGWAFSYKMLRDGRRQIVGFHLPGDLCAADHGILKQTDHSLAALTPVRLAAIKPGHIEKMVAASPRIAKALWANEITAGMIQREWITNLGQRSAYERIAHLLCELHARLRITGLARADSFELPARQAHLAEAAGISAVHVNRMLRQLRTDGLVEFRDRHLVIPDLPGLARAGHFNPAYLDLGRTKAISDFEPRPTSADRGVWRGHIDMPKSRSGLGSS